MKYLLMLVAFTIMACESKTTENQSPESSPTPSPSPVSSTATATPKEEIVFSLQYMKKDDATYLLDQISLRLPSLDEAKEDMAKRFCPRYKDLSPKQRAIVWSTLANAIMFRETGVKDGLLKTCTTFKEPTGQDSIGFFQLSYGDRFCPKKKSEGDLCDTKVNIKCGVQLMAHFVSKDKVVAAGGYTKYGAPPDKGLAQYWSVIRVPDSKSKHHLEEIISKTKKVPGCL